MSGFYYAGVHLDSSQLSQQTDIYASGGIRTRSPSQLGAAHRAAGMVMYLVNVLRSKGISGQLWVSERAATQSAATGSHQH